ncbi:hypothetical protein ACFP3U_20700 [Kitasatospora misakiensis]|uniref:Uncharacterized protein n=1 Tax=Kitasatospora misakiensis TaxID=67330 RepID=A0ABW0X6L8_9ACTN
MSDPDNFGDDDSALDFAADLGAISNLSRDDTVDPQFRAMAQETGANLRYDQHGQVPG